MTCPHCGSETPAALRRCLSCGKAVQTTGTAGSRADVRPPVPPPVDDSAATTFGPPPASGEPAADAPSEDETGFLPADFAAAAGKDRDSAATIAPAPGATPKPPATAAQRTTSTSDRSLTPSGGTARVVPPHIAEGLTGSFGPDAAGAPDGTLAADGGPLAMGESFGSRYHIIRLLGLGGMGAVYQAWDAELGVAVALKVDPAGDRCRSRGRARPGAPLQARAAAGAPGHAQERRPHSRSRRDRRHQVHHDAIRRGGRSRDDPRARRQAAGPARAAHRADDRARAAGRTRSRRGAPGPEARQHHGRRRRRGADHGLRHRAIVRRPRRNRRRLSQGTAAPAAPAADARRQTLSGAIVGTVQYMAPEQARGETADQRADIYAFGLILYDMIVGKRRSAHAQSAVAELQARLQHPPPPVRSIEPNVPPEVDRLVTRCVESDAAKRFQSTAELAQALDRLDEQGKLKPLVRRLTPRMIATAAVVVLLLVAGAYYTAKRLNAPPITHDPVTVVIADFQNRTNDPDIRSGPRPDPETGAGVGELHHSVRRRPGPLGLQRRGAGDVRRAGGASIRHQPGTRGRAGGLDCPIACGIRDYHPRHAGGDRKRRIAPCVGGRRARTRFWKQSPQLVSSARTSLGDETSDFGAVAGDEESVDHLARRGQVLRGCARCAIEGRG